MEDKRKIYQDFSGEMSESVKVARWGAPINGQDDGTKNFFNYYAGGLKGN